MRVFQWMRAKSMRAVLFALFLCLIPASSWAGVLISVGIAPPPLPVVAMADQPPCPQPGWMWTPGYWAYGPDGYYWVPGTWMPAPQPGLYWTPGYWGWSTGLYVWHPGYWGPTVGYYGGVNYGFGYFGIGFVGGVWHGGVFAYNTAVVRVNTVVIHNVYVNRTVIAQHTVAVNSRVAFSGGPGGINHQPTPGERAAMSQHHFAASSMQAQHQNAAMHNTNAYFSHNGGHPSNLASAQSPEVAESHSAGSGRASTTIPSPSSRGQAAGVRRNVTVEPPDGLDYTRRGGASSSNAPHSNAGNHTGHPAPQQHQSHPAPQQQGHEKER